MRVALALLLASFSSSLAFAAQGQKIICVATIKGEKDPKNQFEFPLASSIHENRAIAVPEQLEALSLTLGIHWDEKAAKTSKANIFIYENSKVGAGAWSSAKFVPIKSRSKKIVPAGEVGLMVSGESVHVACYVAKAKFSSQLP